MEIQNSETNLVFDIDLSNKKQHPHVVFPKEYEKSRYTGILKGKYIQATNYFNIIKDSEYFEPLTEVLGYIFPSCPFVDVSLIEFNNYQTDTTLNVVNLSSRFEKLRLKALKRKSLKKHDLVFKSEYSLLIENYFSGDAPQLIGYYEEDHLYFIEIPGFLECKKEPYALKQDVFSRNTGILESDIMLKKGAVLIGCGSVGSLFALELAKAGVGRFLLIDADIFSYHNICRHQCGILDVGKYKTDALKERILQINPDSTVISCHSFIENVPHRVFDDFCNSEAIMVGGADNREGDLYANTIAKNYSMPFLSIGCWERAFAGEIFYCLPEGMPDYEDLVKNTGTMSGRVNINRRFYTTEEELEKVSFEPGISVDIDFVTIVAVKLALDLLNHNNTGFTPRVLNYLTQYTLVCNTIDPAIGGEMTEIFSNPLQITHSIYVNYAQRDNEQ